MKKNLSKLDNEQYDDEFEKMLQEFIDKDDDLDETDTSDDSDADEENMTECEASENGAILTRFGGLRSYMPEILQVDIQVQPNLFGELYVSDDVAVTFHGQRGTIFDEDRFLLNILGEGYFPMANNRYHSVVEHPSPTSMTITFLSRQVWLPGKYVLFVRDKRDASLIRIPFTLDERLEAKVGDREPCQLCSADDVLTSVIDGDVFYWDLVAGKPGMAQIRRYIIENRRFSVYNDFRKAMNGERLTHSDHLLISMRNKDLSESDLDNLHCLVACDYLFRHIDCSTLYDASRVNPYEMLFEELSGTGRQLFCLTNLGALLSTGGKVIVKKLLEKIRSNESQYVLWLCGYKQDIDAVLNMFPSLGKFFPADHRLEQEPYRDFEMVQAFFSELKEHKLYCSVEAMDALARAVLEGCRQGSLSSWTLDDIRRFIQEQVRPRYLARGYREIDNDSLPFVETDDLCLDELTSTTSTFKQCVSDLNGMVGLDEVKKGIVTMANNTRFFSERRRRGLPTSHEATFHCIFTGNPGTGKTTVAKKLGRIYHSLGLLSKGDVIAVDRTRLVGRYIGETEENMKTILEEARGNVLFIDEAYTLYDGASDRKDFGARVIDSLLTVLSQPNPDMLVIFAGYLKEMDAMLNTNPGLMGRFPYKYQFPDYTPEQLNEIAMRLLSRDEYLLNPDAEAMLKESIAKAYRMRDDNFSNARWVEQFIDNGVIPAMADRIAMTACDDYQHIQAADICQAYEKFNPKAAQLKSRRQVGFNA